MDDQGRICCGKHGRPWCPECSREIEEELRRQRGLRREPVRLPGESRQEWRRRVREAERS